MGSGTSKQAWTKRSLPTMCCTLQMDETGVWVRKEDGRAANAKSFMWVQQGGAPGQRIVLCDYVQRHRARRQAVEGWPQMMKRPPRPPPSRRKRTRVGKNRREKDDYQLEGASDH